MWRQAMTLFNGLVGLGASAGIWLAFARAPRGQAVCRAVQAALMLLGALAGARLGYVLLHPAVFRPQPLRAWFFWEGGLSWPGALLGGLLLLLLIALVWRLRLAETADELLVPLLIPLSIVVWLGGWSAGSAYGPAAPQGAWWGITAPDEFGTLAPRFPLQPLAAITLLGNAAWLESKARAFARPGQHASLVLLGTAALMVIFTVLRADSRPAWQGLPLDVWAAFGFLLLAWVSVAAAFIPKGVRDS